MEDYTGKTNEDLLELLEDLNEQQEMFEDDLDDPDYKNMYDKNAEEIIKIKEALNEAESSTIDSEPMEEEVSMPVEAEDSMSMEEIEVYMPEEDEDKLSTDLDQNTLDEIEDDEREFAEETGSNKSEQIERMNEQLNEMLGPKPTESKREVEENLESIKFSDIKIDKSLFFAKGGKTKIGIYEEGGKLKVVNISRVTGGMSPVFRVKFNDGFEMRSSTQDEFIDSEYYKVMDKAIMNYINPQKPIGSTSEQDLYNYEKGGELNKGDVVMQTGKFAESGDYYVVEKDKGNTDGETDNHYQLSEVRKKEQGWFEENDLEKLYAKGGSVRRTNISPLLRYTNFEDGWIFNLVKLNPLRNQDGLKYKGNYKYGISRQGPGKNQEVWQYATLEEANKKYDELIELGKTYSKIKTKGNISKNYAKGGTIDKNLTYKGEVVGFKDDDTGRAFLLGDIDIPKNSTPKSIIELAKSKFKRTWYVEVSKDGEYLYEIADDSYKGEYPMVTAYAKGGEVTYTDTDNYANRRMGNGGIKIWENYKNINNQKAVGSFSHTYNKRNVGDYYLFLLDDYDRNFYSHIALKPNEMLFRNETERGRISKSLPLIKINIKNGRVYFLSEENDYNSDIDDKNPKFSKASADVNYLSLDDRIKKYNQGLITYDELSESVDKTYAKGGTITGAGKSGLDKIKKTSKDNPSQMYKVTDDNYSNIGNFYLKNGKFAKKTVSNADYDFAKNKVSLRPKSDVIYKATEIEGKGGYFEKGGEVDLFEDYEKQPKELAEIVQRYGDDDLNYETVKEFLGKVNAIGYTFDYGLDAEPYDLRPIGDYAEGGTIIKKGNRVRVVNTKFNGQEGLVASNDLENGNYQVQMEDGKVKGFPFENLMLLSRDTYAEGGEINRSKGSSGRYHILSELKGQQPSLYASTNDKKSISKLVEKAEKDLKVLTNKKHNIFVTDSVEDREIYNFEKGGETASPITNYKKNIMGTLSFDLKVKGMRKPQDFIVYPITEKTDKIRIQSDKKFGEIHLPTGNGVLSKSGNTSWHLASDMMNRNINKFELSESEMKELKDKIKATTGKSVGSSFVKSDNSGAELLAEGGKLDMGEVDIYEGVDGDCTVVMHGDVFEMNQHTMPNMSIDMYSGSRSEYPADISHWGKKIDFKDAPIVIKDKVEARTEEFKKGGKLKEANRKWSHRMWFTNSSPDDEYYYENNVIDYLVENPSTFKLTVNRRKLNDYNTLMSVYKDMEIEPGSTYLNPKDIKEYAIKNNRYEWLKIEGDRGSEVRERVIKKYVDRIKEYSDYSEGFDAKELLEQIQILESMAFEEKDEVVKDELRKEANKMRTQL